MKLCLASEKSGIASDTFKDFGDVVEVETSEE